MQNSVPVQTLAKRTVLMRTKSPKQLSAVENVKTTINLLEAIRNKHINIS